MNIRTIISEEELKELNSLYENARKYFHGTLRQRSAINCYENKMGSIASKYICNTEDVHEQVIEYRKKLRKNTQAN